MRAIQLVLSVFVLFIGEYIIFKFAMALDIPTAMKWLAIIVIPVGALAGIFKLIR